MNSKRTITAGGARTFLSAAACETERGVHLRPILREADRNVGVFPCCPCAATRTRRQECPMPLGFDPPHPGGMAENSPTFQRCGHEFSGAQVPKGRLKRCAIRQPSLRDLSDHGRWFPTLKRWAIIGGPSGTKTCPSLAYFVGANPSDILVGVFPCCPCAATRTRRQECPRSARYH
jgi:hypothetical protein